MLKRCVPFRTKNSRRRQRQMTEAHSPSLHPNSPSPSKIIISGKSIGMFNCIVTNFMVHLCLKMEQVGLQDCRIMISAGDFLVSLRVAWRRLRTSFVLAQEQPDWPEFLSLFITAAWKCISWFVFFLTNFCDDKSNMFPLLKKLDPMCIGSSHCTS